MPHATTSIVEPEKNAAASAKNAPESIAPSIPIFITPLCSTSSSPNAASRIGVAIARVELTNASSIGGRLGPWNRDAPAAKACPSRRVEREQNHYHQGLDYLHQHRGNSLGSLHRLRPVVECSEEQRRRDNADWMKPCDQRHCDSLKAPSRRDLLVKAMGDS